MKAGFLATLGSGWAFILCISTESHIHWISLTWSQAVLDPIIEWDSRKSLHKFD